jgi:sec-independent protein translocase protein TatA
MNPIHLMFIGIIALIFLGPKRLPELAKSLGNGMREFRETISLDSSDEPAPPVITAAAPPAPAPVPEVAPPVAPAAPPPVAPPRAPDPA